jgi:imidazolonepropionase-like amidohydrolase
MVQAGLTPAEALSIATRNAAALLKLDDRGVLAPGKLADFVVLDGDPSRDIAQADRIAAVWHRGRQVAGPVEAFAP